MMFARKVAGRDGNSKGNLLVDDGMVHRGEARTDGDGVELLLSRQIPSSLSQMR